MRKTTETRQGTAAFSRTNAEGENELWIRKAPSPRRSVVGKVRDAISRAKLQVKSEPVRLRKQAQALEKENQTLRLKNKVLRLVLKPIEQKTAPDRQQDTRGAATSDPLTRDNDAEAVDPPNLEALVEENKELHARNLILSQMVEADAQMKKVLEVLTDKRSTIGEVREETSQFFKILNRMNAQRAHNEYSVAELYSDRLQRHLGGMGSETLEKLEAATSGFLELDTGSDVGNTAVIQAIWFGTQVQHAEADLLWSTTHGLDLKKARESELSLISRRATALWQLGQQHAPHLKPNDRIPGTKFTVQALKDLLKNSVAANDLHTVTRATNIITAAARSELTKISADDRTELDSAFKVHEDRPELFSDKQKKAVKTLKERLNLSAKTGAALTARQPAVPVTMIKVAKVKVTKAVLDKAALDKAALDKAASDKAKANPVDEAKGLFVTTMREAMKFMADAAAEDDEDYAKLLDGAASGCFLNAINKFQQAVVKFRLNDEAQIRWMRDAVRSMKPEVLEVLRARLNNGLLVHLHQEIASNLYLTRDASDIAEQWWYEVMNPSDASA